ncbi:tyrosine-type recombinase/integrase [Patulibacter sp. SYSU D01012]|uniref:tyrosine-type recombinase/integrase n=1 Tax=Patulibacter sp. SYSU D01012 TaxID=2817381 RepID=UPI001B30DD25|nr:tyrosine-type recombinase/integrase [Patulibacter sp. SYSU D01012]
MTTTTTARRRRPRPKLEKTKVAGVWRRGDRFAYTWRDGAGRQRWGTADTLAGASQAKARRTARRSDVDALLVRVYALEWVERYLGRTSRGIRDVTRREYRRDLEQHVLPLLGARRRLVDLTPRHVADVVAALSRQGLADRTVRKVIAPLRACLATAVEEGLIPSNPCTGVRLPVRLEVQEDEDASARRLTDEELVRVLQAAPAGWSDLLLLLALAGLRISEALALRWKDVVLVGYPVVKVRRALRNGQFAAPKSRHGHRDIPIPASLVDALVARRRTAGSPRGDELVFSGTDGRPLDDGYARRKSIQPAAAAAGVPWASFHTLRHTCASRLFDAGWDVKQVQLFLGHHAPSFTLDTYVHLMSDALPAPLERPPAGAGLQNDERPRREAGA